MELINNLYEIKEQNGDEFKLKLNSENVIYKAHFPERAVTPGVCVIQIAEELLEVYVGLNLTLEEVKNAKFLVVIDPHVNPEISYSITKISKDEQSQSLKVFFVISAEDTIFAKLSLKFKINV